MYPRLTAHSLRVGPRPVGHSPSHRNRHPPRLTGGPWISWQVSSESPAHLGVPWTEACWSVEGDLGYVNTLGTSGEAAFPDLLWSDL